MGRHIAKVICLLVAGLAGWNVLVGLAELHDGWVPPVFGAGTMIVVALVLYFPLARPLADMLADAFATIKPQSPHVRAGTGLDDVPVFSSSPPPPAPRRASSSPAPRMSIPAPRPAVPCKLCGGPGGPICSECEAQMK